jgi:hypothetical protein
VRAGRRPHVQAFAASFSTSFYGGIANHLKDGPVYETGDPTYLAYTFYGNANLQIVSRWERPRAILSRFR